METPRPIRMDDETFFELREFAAKLSKSNGKVVSLADAIQYLLNQYKSSTDYYANIH